MKTAFLITHGSTRTSGSAKTSIITTDTDEATTSAAVSPTEAPRKSQVCLFDRLAAVLAAALEDRGWRVVLSSSLSVTGACALTTRESGEDETEDETGDVGQSASVLLERAFRVASSSAAPSSRTLAGNNIVSRTAIRDVNPMSTGPSSCGANCGPDAVFVLAGAWKVSRDNLTRAVRMVWGVETFTVGNVFQANDCACTSCQDEVLSSLGNVELLGDTALSQCDFGATQVLDLRINLSLELRDAGALLVAYTAEGGAISFGGTGLLDAAVSFIDFAVRREEVQWFSTKLDAVAAGDSRQSDSKAHGFTVAARLLRFAQDTHLLTERPGNVSVCFEKRPGLMVRMLITPRQVDKSKLTPKDLVSAICEVRRRRITAWSTEETQRKSSIDTGVQAVLYARMPHITSFLHFHYADSRPGSSGPLVIPENGCTTFPFPCGCVEEAEECLRTLGMSQLAGTYDGVSDFCIELKDHGYLIGLAEGGVERLENEWENALLEYKKHLRQIGKQDDDLSRFKIHPVFFGVHIRGLLLLMVDPTPFTLAGWSTLFVIPKFRGGGRGEHLVRMLAARGDRVAAHDNCGVLEYYHAHGWVPSAREDAAKMTLLTPPLLSPRKTAVSVVLVFASSFPPRATLWRGHPAGRWGFPSRPVPEARSAQGAAIARELAADTFHVDMTNIPVSAEWTRDVATADVDGAAAASEVASVCLHTLVFVFWDRPEVVMPAQVLEIPNHIRLIDLSRPIPHFMALNTRRVLSELHTQALGSGTDGAMTDKQEESSPLFWAGVGLVAMFAVARLVRGPRRR